MPTTPPPANPIKLVTTVGEMRVALAHFPAEMPLAVVTTRDGGVLIRCAIQGVTTVPGWGGAPVLHFCVDPQNAPFPFPKDGQR